MICFAFIYFISKLQENLKKEMPDTLLYINPKELPLGEVLLYVGNLPADLSSLQYKVIIKEMLGIGREGRF